MLFFVQYAHTFAEIRKTPMLHIGKGSTSHPQSVDIVIPQRFPEHAFEGIVRKFTSNEALWASRIPSPINASKLSITSENGA